MRGLTDAEAEIIRGAAHPTVGDVPRDGEHLIPRLLNEGRLSRHEFPGDRTIYIGVTTRGLMALDLHVAARALGALR